MCIPVLYCFCLSVRPPDDGVAELLQESLSVVKERLAWANRRLQAEPGPEAALSLVQLVRECVLTLATIQTSLSR